MTCKLNLFIVINIYIVCLLIHTKLKSQLTLSTLFLTVGETIWEKILGFLIWS